MPDTVKGHTIRFNYRDASMILYRVAALALYIFPNCKVIIMQSLKSI